MFTQGILVWLILAIGYLTIWFFGGIVTYFIQHEELSLLFRLVGAAVAPAVIIGGLSVLKKRIRV